MPPGWTSCTRRGRSWPSWSRPNGQTGRSRWSALSPGRETWPTWWARTSPVRPKLNFSDALRHWEGRFHKITLEDRNLPAIAEKRVLRPKDDQAKEQLDAAFDQSVKVRQEVLNTLLTSKYDRDIFRKVYPFSPALVDTLIGVSSVLQRERTALKVMMLLLVEQRETLKLGDIVPVGDLFDVIAHGDEAFSQDMAIQFDNAKRLYHQKLLPLLERQHNIRQEEVVQLPTADPRRVRFQADDRLMKTLLLAALVPGVESLKGLNANRLAASEPRHDQGSFARHRRGRGAPPLQGVGCGGGRDQDRRRSGESLDQGPAYRRGYGADHRAGPA